ncbi:MAG: FAD-binding protein [Clostridia bacterium]|nr:FAD-binding protein [Clostridia bacterium]
MKKVYDAIIIGSGAAAYGVADRLYKQGVTNIALIAENRLSGTSRNTGSDKQTYYKLSLDGFSQDSPYRMASDIFAAGCCDGEKMYIQAVNSVGCFLRLCDYGVNFPKDEFGGYPGYKTDHDNTVRATSVGPLTSKIMTEQLEKVVLDKNRTPLYDNRQVIEILKDGEKAAGVAALNTETNEFECFYSHNVVCATGAPACIYENSVYPHSQHGMTGVLIEAGVRLCNFSQWQYGMSSVDFRWNVSGSFMQVVPRFVSVDDNGNEYEFLSECFADSGEMCSNIFLKGYQWPFSFERAEKSSRIDIAVHNETRKGRRVYLDFTRNPQGFSFDALSEEARDYLEKNGATAEKPIERLRKLNPKAIDVYSAQGIDIYTEKLRIAVCAQHNNGGVYTDNNWKTDVEGLYVIGEAAGTFGLARPGGTALNDTQVSALVCARHISKKNISFCDFEVAEDYFEKYGELAVDEAADYSYVKREMSSCAAFLRDEEECRRLLDKINKILSAYPKGHKSLSEYFRDKDMLISAKALLETVIGEMPLTGSRGGAVFRANGKTVAEDASYRKYLTVTENSKVYFEEVKPVPAVNEPFEKYLNEVSYEQT